MYQLDTNTQLVRPYTPEPPIGDRGKHWPDGVEHNTTEIERIRSTPVPSYEPKHVRDDELTEPVRYRTRPATLADVAVPLPARETLTRTFVAPAPVRASVPAPGVSTVRLSWAQRTTAALRKIQHNVGSWGRR